jgi:hypothetical protein
MKRMLAIVRIVMATAASCFGVDTIAQWDYNSALPDGSAATGTLFPSFGSGTASLVGGVSAVFAAGSGNDPAAEDNSGWNTSSYPPQGTSNKTAGVQFCVSTVGYSNIVISWEQKVSASASKYSRLQFSGDGSGFVDYSQPEVATTASSAVSAFESHSASLKSFPEVNNSAGFTFRLVTEWESTALGSGADGYVTTFSTNSYSRAGTIRFDMVTIGGDRIGGANTPPFISPLQRAVTLFNTPTAPTPITVCDNESAAENLSLSAISANPALVPNDPANFIFQGGGSNRTLTVVPANGQTGVAPITVTLSDGTNRATSIFPLMVVPAASVVFCDSFTYSDGALLPNSAFLWEHRAGAYGQCAVMGGALRISADETEDVVGPLCGAPYGPGSNLTLYASFKARFIDLPKFNPGYFAHFADGNTLRARLYASSSNALSGCFKLLVSNGAGAPAPSPWNLHTNMTYTLVTAYSLDSAGTRLWINPVAESDPSYPATDSQTAASISSYGFRQEAQLGGTIFIDDLRIGLSFTAVMTSAATEPLAIRVSRGNVILFWQAANCSLQKSQFPYGPFYNIAGAISPYTNPCSASAGFFRLSCY